MIIAIINNKGGVGKTTSAVNLSAAWAHAGRSTLLVDLDSQCSASLHLGVRPGDARSTVSDLFSGRSPEPVPTRVTGLDILAGAPELSDFDLETHQRSRRHSRSSADRTTQVLSRGLNTLADKYQRIVLDCPPSLSFVTVSAIVGAHSLLLPVTPSYLAVEGLVQFTRALQRISVNQGASAQILGILLTMVDTRMRLTGEVVDLLRSHYGNQVLSTEIKVNVKLAEASSFGQSIFEYDPRCPGARLYKQLLAELEARCLVPAAVA